jgi:hypothetical protein
MHIIQVKISHYLTHSLADFQYMSLEYKNTLAEGLNWNLSGPSSKMCPTGRSDRSSSAIFADLQPEFIQPPEGSVLWCRDVVLGCGFASRRVEVLTVFEEPQIQLKFLNRLVALR